MKTKAINGKIRIDYNDDYIFYYTFLPKSDIDMESAREMVRTGTEWGGHLPYCVNLIDMRDMLFIKSEVRTYFANQKPDNLIANALVINSNFHSGLVNLYFRFSKPVVPTKSFTGKNEAVAWLKSQLQKQ